MLFQVFRLNFSWNVPKIHYFSNKSLKIAKRWGLSAHSALSSWLWRNRTSNNQLWRHFSDVIVIMSLKNVTKITSYNFSFWVLRIKISGYASAPYIQWRNWRGANALLGSSGVSPYLKMGPLIQLALLPKQFHNFKCLVYANLLFCYCSKILQSFAQVFFKWILHCQDC